MAEISLRHLSLKGRIMKKVCDFEYRRVTLEEVKSGYEQVVNKIRNAKSADEIIKVRNTDLKKLFNDVATYGSLAYMRYTCNTKDEFYTQEQEYYDENMPIIVTYIAEYQKAMVESPFRAELEKVLGKSIFKKYEFSIKVNDERVVAEKQEEAAIGMEYSKLMSTMKFKWEGEEVPLSIVRGKKEDSDREVRRKAAFAMGEGLKAHAKELDDIFDRLVKVRDKIAKKLGFKNYVEYGYYAMDRVDYDRDMIETFRKNVAKSIVPKNAELIKDVTDALGYDSYTFYDEGIYSEGEQPVPVLSPDGILNAGLEMYKEMSDVTGDFMQKMMDASAFDVLSRDGKWGGGYAIDFPDFDQPFILANFNGSSGDVDVITHEFGHTLAMNFVHKYGDFEMDLGGNETAECHSMSMEFFCWKFMDKFFGKNTNKYLRKHLSDALIFIPYGCMVDEFQHIVYENPELTPEDRKKEWLKLEKKYRPYLNIKGVPYIEEGTRWQYQMHSYESPFDDIEYCLAQTVAVGFLIAMNKDYDKAFDKYIEFSKCGGTVPFPELVKNAGLPDPFTDGTLDVIASGALDILKSLS